MLYRALADSPGSAKKCCGGLLQKRAGLGRLDSGIDLDFGLGNSLNLNGAVLCPEDFLVVHVGDVFRQICVPNEKRLIYVEKVNSISLVEEETEEVFDMDVNCRQEAMRGYIPAERVVMDASSEGETVNNWCSTCGRDVESQNALIKKLEEENSCLKDQLHELKLTNESLLDSVSWNGDDDLGLSRSLLELPCSPRSPSSRRTSLASRQLRSPRPFRSRTLQSESSDVDAETLFRVFDLPVEKNEENQEDDIMLSCTLCSRKIKLTELEIHSKVCSSEPSAAGRVPLAPDVLFTNVTQISFKSSTEQLLKVITKTTLEKFNGHVFEVNRTIDDFTWFREMLQRCCPSRIVPSFKLHGNVNGNFREVQRFLRRLTAHKVLKSHNLVKEFLCEKDVEPVKSQYDAKHPDRLSLSPHQLSQASIDKNSLMHKATIYITSLLEKLRNLTDHLRTNIEREVISDGVSEKFKVLSDVEMKETYLKFAASGLSRITQVASFDKEESHETALVEELESIIGNIEEAQQMLKRVEMKTENFLYWEEQMKLYEKQTQGNKAANHSSKAECTKKWAEASANFAHAKCCLENMCKHVSEELTNFDYSKERDLKEILVDFADGKFQYYEKLQSKWYGVRIMLDANIIPNQRAFDMA